MYSNNTDDPYILLIKDAVPKNFCKNVINRFESLISQQPENDSSYIHGGRKNRSDKFIAFDVADIDIASCINRYLHDAFKTYRNEVFELDYMNLESYRVKVQRTLSGEGYHTWHCEQDGKFNDTRIMTWSLFLNDVKEGGETEFLKQGIRIKPEAGMFAFWPGAFMYQHRGNPPISGAKYIATGWYNISE